MSDIMSRMTSKEYTLLLQMYRLQTEMPDGQRYVPISQRELADIVGINPMTANSYYKFFEYSGLIKPYQGKNSRYFLTEKAISIINHFEAVREELNSEEI